LGKDSIESIKKRGYRYISKGWKKDFKAFYLYIYAFGCNGYCLCFDNLLQ
jgi:hypothetical protein